MRSHQELGSHLPEEAVSTKLVKVDKMLTLGLNGQWKSTQSAVGLSPLANCTVPIFPTMIAPASFKRCTAGAVAFRGG